MGVASLGAGCVQRARKCNCGMPEFGGNGAKRKAAMSSRMGGNQIEIPTPHELMLWFMSNAALLLRSHRRSRSGPDLRVMVEHVDK